MKCPQCGNEEEFIIVIRPDMPSVRIQIRKIGQKRYEIQSAIHCKEVMKGSAQCTKCGHTFDPDDRVEIVGIEKLTGVLDV